MRRVELEFAAGRGGGYSGCHRQHRNKGACERIRFSESIALICGAFRRCGPHPLAHMASAVSSESSMPQLMRTAERRKLFARAARRGFADRKASFASGRRPCCS